MTLPAVLALAGLAVVYVAAVFPTAARRRRERETPSEPIEPRTPFDDARGYYSDQGPDLPDPPDLPSAD